MVSTTASKIKARSVACRQRSQSKEPRRLWQFFPNLPIHSIYSRQHCIGIHKSAAGTTFHKAIPAFILEYEKIYFYGVMICLI